MRQPTELYVFIHEAASGIDDSLFTIAMGDVNTFVNCNSAAALHNSGTAMGFADGHSETHRWVNTQKNTTTAQEEINRMLSNPTLTGTLVFLEFRP